MLEITQIRHWHPKQKGKPNCKGEEWDGNLFGEKRREFGFNLLSKLININNINNKFEELLKAIIIYTLYIYQNAKHLRNVSSCNMTMK